MSYFFLWLKHKWFVFVAGRRLCVPIWRLLKHDLSKLSFKEYIHYQRYFFSKDKEVYKDSFQKAWLHHINHNEHHWEYWFMRNKTETVPIEMPDVCIREMIADWIGASRAYQHSYPTCDNWAWRDRELKYILDRVAPNTRDYILDTLNICGLVPKYFIKVY